MNQINFKCLAGPGGSGGLLGSAGPVNIINQQGLQVFFLKGQQISEENSVVFNSPEKTIISPKVLPKHQKMLE